MILRNLLPMKNWADVFHLAGTSIDRSEITSRQECSSRGGTNELSVDRVYDDNLPKVTNIAVAHDVGRGRSFYGWVVVTQDMAARNGRSIKASPREDNEFHADIVLPLEVVSDKEKRQQHASELATYARWQDPGRFG